MIKLEQSKYARVTHIIEVAIAVLLGTVPYIFIAANSRFHIGIFPPLYCGADPVYSFYATILPTVLVYCASLIMMLFMLYKIHIVSHICHGDRSIVAIAYFVSHQLLDSMNYGTDFMHRNLCKVMESITRSSYSVQIEQQKNRY